MCCTRSGRTCAVTGKEHFYPERTGESRRPSYGEPIEFAISYSVEKRSPFFWCEKQYRAADVLAVAHADLALRQVSYLDTISIRMTQRALSPGIHANPSG